MKCDETAECWNKRTLGNVQCILSNADFHKLSSLGRSGAVTFKCPKSAGIVGSNRSTKASPYHCTPPDHYRKCLQRETTHIKDSVFISNERRQSTSTATTIFHRHFTLSLLVPFERHTVINPKRCNLHKFLLREYLFVPQATALPTSSNGSMKSRPTNTRGSTSYPSTFVYLLGIVGRLCSWRDPILWYQWSANFNRSFPDV